MTCAQVTDDDYVSLATFAIGRVVSAFVTLARSLYGLDVNRKLSASAEGAAECPPWHAQGSLLSVAAWAGCEGAVKWLLEAQADVGVSDEVSGVRVAG